MKIVSRTSYISENIIRIILSEIYELEDIWKYDSLTVDNNQYSVTRGTFDISYNSNGCTAKGTRTIDCYAIYNDLTLPTEYEASFIWQGKGTDNYITEIGFDNVTVSYNNSAKGYLRNMNGGAVSSNGIDFQVGDKITVKVTGTNSKTAELYLNDVYKVSISGIGATGTHRLKSYNNRSTTFKDLKIKAL